MLAHTIRGHEPLNIISFDSIRLLTTYNLLHDSRIATHIAMIKRFINHHVRHCKAGLQVRRGKYKTYVRKLYEIKSQPRTQRL